MTVEVTKKGKAEKQAEKDKEQARPKSEEEGKLSGRPLPHFLS